MQRNKICCAVFACFLTAAAAAGQGILSAKDTADTATEQRLQDSEKVKNWGGGYGECTYRIQQYRRINRDCES